ncbi:NUDIX domain-containing protein, partial [Patescibacteria group bacterium]|nr:NUDIX domain-containing protein [Patescibacteria group bacterium]
GAWSTAVGGHVMSGEDYVQGALREFEEELGVLAGIEFFSKDLYEVNEKLKKFVTVFKTNYNGPFNPNKDDVDLVDFFTIQEIKEMIDGGEQFHPELLFLLKKYFIKT